jgi:hypothetical protein
VKIIFARSHSEHCWRYLRPEYGAWVKMLLG